jgi:uncharacterized protein YabN with tetrapyrrole methylase and pyrophosphatase domain
MRSCVVAMFLVIACGQSKHEVFLEGQKIEGDAERGACKLQYEPDAQAQVINTEIVSTCLAETEKAIALYEKAKSMGYDDADFQRVYDRAIERRDNLKSMLKMVGSMELEQDLEKAPFKAEAR